jgi:hypothetical protein
MNKLAWLREDVDTLCADCPVVAARGLLVDKEPHDVLLSGARRLIILAKYPKAGIARDPLLSIQSGERINE